MHSKTKRAWSVRSIGIWLGVFLLGLAISLVHATPAYAYATRYSDIAVAWEDDDNPGREYGDRLAGAILANGVGWGAVRYTGDGATDEAVIYSYDAGTFGDIVIPNTLSAPDGIVYKVVGLVSIGDINGEDKLSSCVYSNGQYRAKYALGSGTGIKSITIPDNVRFIGKGAFNQYLDLENVNFAEGGNLTTIESGAFANCVSLLGSGGTGKLTIPSSVTTIGDGAFTNCSSLTSVVFPAGIDIAATVMGYADGSLATITNAPKQLEFEDSPTSLTTVSFSPGIETVEGISNGPNITSITIPEGVKGIGYYAFHDLESLQSITFPESLVYIDAGAFQFDESLSYIQGLEHVQFIGGGAFAHCPNLSMDIVHPGQLDAQYEDTAITSLTITAKGEYGDDVKNYLMSYGWTEDDDYSFDNSNVSAEDLSDCNNLRAINVVNGSTDTVWSEDGVLFGHARRAYKNDGTYRIIGERLVKYPAVKSGGSYVIPSNIKSVDVGAFEGCAFSEIHIPVTVEDLCTFREYGGTVYSPFTGMATTPTLYYVENSYVDPQFRGYESPIVDEWFDMLSPGYHFISYDGPVVTEPGPEVKIEYSPDGGNYSEDSPTSVVGGESVTLPPWTHDRYEFRGWRRCLPAGGYEYIPDNKLTPRLDELANRTVTVEPGWYYPLKYATVTLSATSLTYTAKELKPTVTVTYTDGNNTKTLKEGTNFTVAYANNVNVGTATVTVTGNGSYTGTATSNFTITKAANPMKAKAAKAKVTVKLAKVNKKAQTLASNVKFTKKSPTGVTYANGKGSSKTKKWKVNKKTGKLTVPKGTKKGTYKVKIKVTAKASPNYVTPKAQTVTYKVIVK